MEIIWPHFSDAQTLRHLRPRGKSYIYHDFYIQHNILPTSNPNVRVPFPYQLAGQNEQAIYLATFTKRDATSE